MSVELYEHQRQALKKMHNGCILCGGVGSGKSRTAIAYYHILYGGRLKPSFEKMTKPKNLYIITTAHKRDTLEWESEMVPFHLSCSDDSLYSGLTVAVDSWNNIGKYKEVKDSFFIFDEQRVVGNGAWVKAFLAITKRNEWILLSATPGDTWMDYIPVFIANGFYKNRTEFVQNHVIWNRYRGFYKVDKYVGTKRLEMLREQVLVDMDFERPTTQHQSDIFCDYDIESYKSVMRERWNIYKNEPVVNASELCGVLRRIVNSDISRQSALLELLDEHPKVIVFYNYNYELAILEKLLDGAGYLYAEWNGFKHEPVPVGDAWAYLVQYTAGCEGWNCITTDTVIFYSQNYSYKVMIQAAGRIDRLNTPFKDLWYYTLKSRSSIDISIGRALKNKKQFNENRFVSSFEKREN